MNRSADVDAWFANLSHPLEPIMQRVRAIILDADPRMTEVVRYGTIHFESHADMASFVQLKDRQRVSLMFNAAGRLTGSFPHLEGTSVKYLRFRSEADVDDREVELQAMTREWCER